ncbi:MAG: hypothetical protein WDA59_11675 [Methanofastidiosum sp.]|jgi:hypothetical protein
MKKLSNITEELKKVANNVQIIKNENYSYIVAHLNDYDTEEDYISILEVIKNTSLKFTPLKNNLIVSELIKDENFEAKRASEKLALHEYINENQLYLKDFFYDKKYFKIRKLNKRERELVYWLTGHDMCAFCQHGNDVFISKKDYFVNIENYQDHCYEEIWAVYGGTSEGKVVDETLFSLTYFSCKAY